MTAPTPASRPPALSRRAFLGLGPGAVGLAVAGPARRVAAADAPPSDVERLHRPRVRLPRATANGGKVPIVVEMAHPMEPDHYIERIHVLNPRDPVPSKGVFHFTPANGQAYLALQARLDAGASEVVVTAECTRHGSWSARQPIVIEPGAGGCAGVAPPPGRITGDEISAPAIRIPQLVADGVIRRRQIIDVQVAIKHPNRTGLHQRDDGTFVRVGEPLYISELVALYGGDRVSTYAMTPALSDNPFITFRLRAGDGGPLQVRLANNRGQRFEAAADVTVV
jgi:desulfoferrodoxin (superoxide reductase-like protein)